ncbi:putative C-Myc-binding protein [Histomonas meleagridis]|uniref:putative C-Myc-binding protein n=1 Tax=Histomonas meleagridis TaxID=135588 RepID=UPI00355AC898|nr:putative C-Myc-binding protein [Histomonas meleagridis]KAH0804801.1 putative C-Myc-binding protein [Histomonas meleagridis]
MATQDGKREAFRKYLEDSGMLDSITKVLAHLYNNFDESIDPLQYVKEHLGNPEGVNVEELKAKNASLRQEVEQLEARLQSLKNK